MFLLHKAGVLLCISLFAMATAVHADAATGSPFQHLHRVSSVISLDLLQNHGLPKIETAIDTGERGALFGLTAAISIFFDDHDDSRWGKLNFRNSNMLHKIVLNYGKMRRKDWCKDKFVKLKLLNIYDAHRQIRPVNVFFINNHLKIPPLCLSSSAAHNCKETLSHSFY